jgi:hypothetical protein
VVHILAYTSVKQPNAESIEESWDRKRNQKERKTWRWGERDRSAAV